MSYKILKILVLPVLLLFSLIAGAQSLSFLTGYGININSPGPSFNFIPVEVRWHPFRKNTVSFWARYEFGFPYHSTGNAYTLNPSLPSHIVLKEKVMTHILTFGIAFNINLIKMRPDRRLTLTLMPVCIGAQPIKVKYGNYDKENYEILNQAMSKTSAGLVIGWGVNFMLNKHSVISLFMQSPPLRTKWRYVEYYFSAPLTLTFGYRIPYK